MNIRRYISTLLLLFGCIISLSAEVMTNVPQVGDMVCALETEFCHYDATGKVSYNFFDPGTYHIDRGTKKTIQIHSDAHIRNHYNIYERE